MARPQHRKARKDYPEAGIQKGDMYWYVSIKTGPRSSRVMRQKQPFKASQLTTSDFLRTAYDLNDRLSEITPEQIAGDELEDIASEIEELGEDQREKFDNMPEGLQYSPTGELLEGRAESCEEWKERVEELHNEKPDEPDGWSDEYFSGDGPDEPEEPEEAEYDDADEYEAAHDEWETEHSEWETLNDQCDEYRDAMDELCANAKDCAYEGE